MTGDCQSVTSKCFQQRVKLNILFLESDLKIFSTAGALL